MVCNYILINKTDILVILCVFFVEVIYIKFLDHFLKFIVERFSYIRFEMPKDFNNNNESSRSRARDDAINSYLGFFNERTSETGSDEETESGEEMEVDQQQQHALDWEAEEEDDDDGSDMSCSSDGCDCAVLYQEDQVVPDMNRQIANDHSDCRLYESRDGQVLVREDHRSDRQLYDEDINVNYNYLLSQRDDLRMRILRLQIYLNDLKRATDGMVPQVNE